MDKQGTKNIYKSKKKKKISNKNTLYYGTSPMDMKRAQKIYKSYKNQQQKYSLLWYFSNGHEENEKIYTKGRKTINKNILCYGTFTIDIKKT